MGDKGWGHPGEAEEAGMTSRRASGPGEGVRIYLKFCNKQLENFGLRNEMIRSFCPSSLRVTKGLERREQRMKQED